MTRMTDELRQQAANYGTFGRIPIGDTWITCDIRAALVQADGSLVRSLNGSIMEPGTDLFAFPNNEPPTKTIKALLAVIDAQNREAIRLREVCREAYCEGFSDAGAYTYTDGNMKHLWENSSAAFEMDAAGRVPVVDPEAF